MFKKIITFLVCFVVFSPAYSNMVVGVSEMNPVCFKDDQGNWKGFEIDLINEVSKIFETSIELREAKGRVKEKLSLTTSGDIDIGICGISHKLEREKVNDFVPIMDSGLQAFSLKDQSLYYVGDNAGTRIFIFLGTLFATALLIWIIEHTRVWFSVVNNNKILWYFLGERYQGEGIEKIGDGVNCQADAATTRGSGSATPKTLLGYVVMWTFTVWALINLTNFLIDVQAVAGLERSKHSIETVYDLQGFSVGTVRGASSFKYLDREIGVTAKTYNDFESLKQALIDGKVDIGVYDLPIVKRSSSMNNNIVITGPVFSPEYYAWSVQQGSPLREKLTLAILQLKENGKFAKLERKWLGK